MGCHTEVVAEDVAYAGCKVGSIAIACHITVLQVVYHLGYAAYVEAYAGCAATHGFGDGVGQVVLQAGREEDIGSIVELWHHLFADRAKAGGSNTLGQGYLLCILAHNHQMESLIG